MLPMVQYVIHRLRLNEKGQSLTEYALILGLIAIVVIGTLAILGGQILEVFERITTELGGALGG